MTVDFNVANDHKVRTFSYECTDDILRSVLPKFEFLLDHNKSIAVGCPFLLNFKQETDINAFAYGRMKGDQVALYKKWKAGGIPMEPHEWTQHEVAMTEAQKKSFGDQHEAVKELFQKDDITMEQAKFWIDKKVKSTEHQSLYGAIRAYASAKRSAFTGYKVPDIKIAVEIRACSKLHKTLNRRHSKKVPTGNLVIQSIDRVSAKLKDRMTKYKDPETDA